LVAHGDIFLQDLREYRERNLTRVGMQGLFPLWQRDTRELLDTFFRLKFKAYLCCVEGNKLGRSFAGRALNVGLLADLPANVDPCGENGEYHTFVFDGPIFRTPIALEIGEVVERDNRFYADLLPSPSVRAHSSKEMPPVVF
jgi:uncharacterized protein (TIGR00290 family)